MDHAARDDDGPIEVSVVMPCLNEEGTVAACVRAALDALTALKVAGEVVVADNGSIDRSVQLARDAGARVVEAPARGYGAALQAGIAAARGRYVVMADSDGTYDLSQIDRFIAALRDGAELVVGNRFAGGIERRAMPALHRYVGNPALTTLGRLFFRSPVRDFHCGMRAFVRDRIAELDLRTTGMEFASEMIVKATLHGLCVAEVPTTLSPQRRARASHLRPWRDGWRHLRFLLLYSPRWLFLYPGVVLMAAGAGVTAWLLPAPRRVGDVELDVQTLLYAAFAIVLGFQAVLFSVLTKVFAVSEGLLPADRRMERLTRVVTLETGLAAGGALAIAGLAGSVAAFLRWSETSFGPLDASENLRIVIPSVVALALGIELVFSSFLLSLLGMRRR